MILDFRINAKGELEGKVMSPAKWEEMYTKEDVIAMLTELQLELNKMKITKVRSAGFAPYSKDPFRHGVNCSREIIQKKINALRVDQQNCCDKNCERCINHKYCDYEFESNKLN